MIFKTERIYSSVASSNDQRILVDRLWPRGVSKQKAQLDGWWKELAPTTDLRKWFGHEAEKWPEFQIKYKQELATKEQVALALMATLTADKPVVLLFGAKDEVHNHPVVLKEFLEKLV